MSIFLLLVLLTGPVAFTARAACPALEKHTTLEVKQAAGEPNAWGTSRTIQSLQIVTLRWSTNVPNTAYGEWEIAPNGMNEQPFAKGTVPLSQPGQFGQFTIDFAQLQQQHPDKIPANAPGTAKNYHIRLVPWSSSGVIAAFISPAVKITYRSGQRLQEVGGTLTAVPQISDVRVSPNRIALLGQGILGVFLTISKPSSMIVRLSQSAPVFDSNHNPTFASGTEENSVYVSSFHTKHYVGLFDLLGETHYYYIIEVTDKEGHKAYTQGDFEMGKLRTPLG
ncbi:MAG: hypothetical protein ABJB97_00030 [Acidobacteriota bacterium]